ncbi:MAG: hypothetical protein R3B06_29410 [Kofleriaceae bacterium]
MSRPFEQIARADLGIVTGGLTSSIRTRRQAPEMQQAQQPSGVEQKLAGLMSALQGGGQAAPPAQPAPAPSPMDGLMKMMG